MSSLARKLFVGPVVVVDDEVFKDDTDAFRIAKELEREHFPVLRRTTLPDAEELCHWQPMSMIVLDWNLIPKAELSQSSDEADADAIALGTSIPDPVRLAPELDSLGFVRKLQSELYCPVFIISNVEQGAIWQALLDGLDESETMQLEARVMVRSKSAHGKTLLDSLSQWVSEHPAIYALKVWQLEWDRAKADLFRDLQASSVEWPGILWRTSDKDSVNPNQALSETITRNLQHRVKPNLFDRDLIVADASTDDAASLDAVRRVLHRQAVVPAEKLHDDVIMPGDFFYGLPKKEAKVEAGWLPNTIAVCVTPACDLVPRSDDIDGIRLLLVPAKLIPRSERKTEAELEELLRDDNSATSLLLHHIVPEDAMYRVHFRDWHVRSWKRIKNQRQGRLLDPYITLLQQRYAQHAQRQGVPRLPEGFYSAEPSDQVCTNE